MKDVNGPLKTLEDPLLIDAIEGGRGSGAPETIVDEKEDSTADATFPIRFPVVAPENREKVQEEYASEQTGIKICTVKDRRIIHISSPSQKIVNSLFPKYLIMVQRSLGGLGPRDLAKKVDVFLGSVWPPAHVTKGARHLNTVYCKD